MRGAQGARHWCRRPRRNPLRRRADVVEAWLVLVVWTVIMLGGALVGLVAAHAADESFARLRHDRHTVSAVLLESSGSTVPSGEGSRYDQVRATVRWTTPDGAPHTGRALVKSGHRAGSHVDVWLNGRGQLSTAPPSAGSAAVESGLFGVGAALALAGLTVGAGAFARWRLDERRYDEWGREWDQVGPQWGRRTP
ncbi:hypothetical protein ABZT23_05820 [Streptomyces sp. NPDC005386]|uniref:Rv1733c family protein n=1 Tax=Streptomyces sp. NPDC005386 TaxID=3154562 RepID=UPI0033AD6468